MDERWSIEVAGQAVHGSYRPGDGPTVVLLHSSGQSGAQWRRMVADLSAWGLGSVAVDLIGSGRSAPWVRPEPFEIGWDVDLVAAVADRLDGEVALVGHSYGGVLALRAALREPGRYSAIAVYEPPLWGIPRGLGDAATLAMFDHFTEVGFFDPAEAGGDAWLERFVDFWNGPGAWWSLPERSREAMRVVGLKVYWEVSALCFDTIEAEAYRAIPTPTLVLRGSRSPAPVRALCATLAEVLPNGRLEELAGLGHMGPVLAPGVVNPRILAHVAP